MSYPIKVKIPDSLLVRLGRVAAAFASVEYYLADGTWRLLDPHNPQVGMRKTLRMNGSRLRRCYREGFDDLINRARATPYEREAEALEQSYVAVEARLCTATDERNRYLHAAWLSGRENSAYSVVEDDEQRMRVLMMRITEEELDGFVEAVEQLAADLLEVVTWAHAGLAQRINTNAPPSSLY